MKRREAVAALFAGASIVLALLAVFAVQLTDDQARSRSDLEAQAHQRAVLVAGLIDSVFDATSTPNPQLLAEYGMRTVSDRTLERNRGTNEYVALLGSGGQVLAASKGFDTRARTDVAAPGEGAVSRVRAGRAWALGNVRPYERSGVIDFATAIDTRWGRRILVTGIDPALLSAFTTRELTKVPDPQGAHHYLLDGNGVVIASTNPKRPRGYHFHTPVQIDVLTHPSGTVNHHYFDQVPLANTTWRVLLSAPDSAFFASVSGANRWLPWVIFGAFALVALVALVLGGRALRSSAQVERANAELAKTNAELERRADELARSNAELEQFASIASHDLQEPLRKVRTFTGRVSEIESTTLSQRGRDYLRRADASAARMQRLIEDLLMFSRVATQTRPFVDVDLGQVTREVLEDLDDLVRRTDAVVRVGPLPTIAADPPQMHQLLQNLISNALKFRRGGVRPEVDLSAVVANGSMRLVVRDNGIGFEPQYAERIFRVFERLHGRGAYPGTGIGLAVCRKIADRHGGTITAEGALGRGAALTVTLPVRQTSPGGPRTPAPASGETIEHEEPYVAV
jgi:signal transduction histidine kinase